MNNKLINILLLLLLALFISFRLFTACNQIQEQPQAELSDPISTLPAVFTGTIPCADCPGIEVHLLLKENNRFRELNWYRDRNPEPMITEGAWSLRGDTLALFDDEDKRFKTYLYSEETVTMLDSHNRQITGDLSEMYVLERSQMESGIRERHEELRTEEGIVFLASGNEPFWSVRVDSSDVLSFITPESEWSEQAGHQIAGDELFVWTTRHNSINMTVTAEKNWCTDTMSGFLFTHQVTVVLNNSEQRELRGCGRFLGNE
ncbi:copper resistance protein NlpE N-terminal domain-containing protein [Rhodohalobacter mucosus]|uniref:NlpE N-terminal domain-containing protein n=1 Tax=Rhodohalobacter mucosus TaxID=2079485 RepID=A0A316TPT3_9BACT|nr:copper resistance protein NlpE N-terminal domain-containing protein [Rhodohalobacter mucosus]PWN06633.1 hypothetical protein DDZ15_08945 [Rhodohalobacter mucosus]